MSEGGREGDKKSERSHLLMVWETGLFISIFHPSKGSPADIPLSWIPHYNKVHGGSSSFFSLLLAG